MVRLIMEKEFEPPLTVEEHNAEARRVDPCLVAHEVRWIRSLVSADRRRMICEFEAADADSVRMAFRSARVVFSRVWVAELFEPGGGARGGWEERVAAQSEPKGAGAP
jgi:hypothetical protein